MKKGFENFTFFTFALHFKSSPNAYWNYANGHYRKFRHVGSAIEGVTRASAHGPRSILGPIIMNHGIFINCHIVESIIIFLRSIIIVKQTHCFPKGPALLPSRYDILFVLIIDGKRVILCKE